MLLIGGLAPIFDTTIVSVALHTLAGQLHTSLATIQWVSTAYLLALGVTIPLAGWAQGRFGGRRVWMSALVIFLAGSIASSVAWSAATLIAFRAVQGIGNGLLAPLQSTPVIQAAGGKALGRAMSVVSLPASLGPVLGPVLGRVILNWLDWRWLFWVNVPFCVAGFLLARKLLPADTSSSRPRLDVAGFVLLSPGIVGILYGISNASMSGGFARTDVLAPVLTGVVLLTAFGIDATRRGDLALVDLRLFAHRAVASASALLFLSGDALFRAMLLLPVYFQDVRGTGALGAGLLLVPQEIGSLFSRSLAGRLTDAIGAKWVTAAGFAIAGAATVPFALATGRPANGSSWEFWFSAASSSAPSHLAVYRRIRRAQPARDTAREHHHADCPANRRFVRRRHPRRHSRRRARQRHKQQQPRRYRVRPGILVVHRLHRPRRPALACPARPTPNHQQRTGNKSQHGQS